jgi:osmotically inducible protein OsmC
MVIRTAQATWEGSLQEGHGSMRLGSGAFEGAFSYASRFEQGPGTNPEELLGAAHAGCFSMAFSSRLTKAGHAPRRIDTHANVHFGKVDGVSKITKIELETRVDAPGIEPAEFLRLAEDAKLNCPVSAALTGVEITLTAQLQS